MAGVKKTTEKTETKAKTTRTRTAKVKEPTVTVEFQFQGKNTAVKDLVETIKAAYKAEGNEDAIETVALYVQPGNGVVYYVVNGKSEGKCIAL